MRRPGRLPPAWRGLPGRVLAVALGGVALAVGVLGAWRGGVRLTLSNTGLRLDHPLATTLYALLAMAGALALSAALRSRGLRILALATFAGLLGLAGSRLAFRVDAGSERLSVRGLTGSRAARWSDVTRVDTGPDEIRLEHRGGLPLRVPVSALRPDQRASLERAIARHVAEAHSRRDPR